MTLSIFLDNIIVWAPNILYFEGLGMRNLQCEMKICQKSHNKVTKTVYVKLKFLWIRRYYSSCCRLPNKAIKSITVRAPL